ncbi:hypothetical protein [Siphonobacter sp. SORGH_AS_0500]|uniref:hypothetical protein n=1 Tax=Siphonobacter sp. SORGH_AS_0500 TaxID=1864824 RepID=UPI002865964D|nr:hypothetical protein [Siphonobacter sp. SORGH_AS_0500]MDR6195761.1 hypothetical protein [Siphonobacter sp. SORGH_AS_0500]
MQNHINNYHSEIVYYSLAPTLATNECNKRKSIAQAFNQTKPFMPGLVAIPYKDFAKKKIPACLV